jgi:2',3'-cyclic-nucleotide 2'-phosphodiesterase/3'-nucleotidase
MKITLDILSYADFSGRIRKSKSNPGLPAFVANIDSIREQNPEGTLVLDAGDQFTANLWGGLPMVEAMNVMGVDVMTLGNHEFDWGRNF